MVEHSSINIKKLLSSSEAFFIFKPLSLDNLQDCYSIEKNSKKQTSIRTEKDLSDFLNSYQCYGYFLNDTLLGFAIFSVVENEAELIDITINFSARNYGIGFSLLKSCFNTLSKQKIETVILEVAINNLGAIKLYEKLSAIQIGTRKNYYTAKNNSKIDALVYKINL